MAVRQNRPWSTLPWTCFIVLEVLTFTTHHKQLCAVCYVHSHVRESGGMLPQENFKSKFSEDNSEHVLRQQTKMLQLRNFRPAF